MSLFHARKEVDMTEGSIVRHLILFALPLLVGNLFQQLYNTVDTYVVGNFVGDAAFAAVGNVGPIINTLIGFFSGLASGAGVVISQYFGAGRTDKVEKAVGTSIALTFLMGVVFTALGILLTPFFLGLMDMPADKFADAQSYLTIYFAGVIGLMVYNMGSGILRAIGDSMRPFLFLVVSALLNTGLDLWFVIGFGMGVEGVAYATIIAQGVSAVLVLIELCVTKSCVRLRPSALLPDLPILGHIFRVGLPAALQMAVTAFSNIFVQGYINYFDNPVDTGCMGGWTAYAKIDQFIMLPLQSLSLAATTFVGQNYGFGNAKRARRGANIALLLSMAGTVILMIPVMIFAPELTAFFNSNPGVVEHGALFLRWITPFYVLCCVNQIYAGALRGAGRSFVPMIIMLGSFVAFRQVYLFVMSNVMNEVIPIVMGYPAGWLVAGAATVIYYRFVPFDKRTELRRKKKEAETAPEK